ncbi:hypothetical protein [Hirschia litorea]|uniref:Uncharacterized protein n=1 Tax=Hirschia litorea TaxID=1199156 RepID=A0ABW2IJ05_9PROT
MVNPIAEGCCVLMLFLLNDQVLDVGDPRTTIREFSGQLTDIPYAKLRAPHAISLGQALFYHCPADRKPSAGALRALGALIFEFTEANAALFVRPLNAKGPQDVQLRLAEVQLPVIANLFQQQTRKPLSPVLVNDCVWSSAA